MPFQIVRNDITQMRVDAIVNTANPQPVICSGTDAMVHANAGAKLLAARQKIGTIRCGDAAITPAFDLQAKYVIHTVGPVWSDGSQEEESLLRSCYDNSLKLALEHNCQSVAFPLISTGNYGFPKDKALQIAISAFHAFLTEQEMQIYLVVYDHTAFKLSEKLFQNVASYIDENFTGKCEFAAEKCELRSIRPPIKRQAKEIRAQEDRIPAMRRTHICRAPRANDLDNFLKKKDAGFIETLKELIQKQGLKNATVYKRANMSKQHFSKLINSPNANPTKPTAIALALALELNLEQTIDLIGRAGYTLTNSSVFDLIIQYYIQQKNYNIIEINITLYEFDQILLGS